MKCDKEPGNALTGHLVIATGLLQVVSIHIPAMGIVLALLAIAAGGLILVDGKRFGLGKGKEIGYILRDIMAGTYYRQPEAQYAR
jgi:hypothetical protein